MVPPLLPPPGFRPGSLPEGGGVGAGLPLPEPGLPQTNRPGMLVFLQPPPLHWPVVAGLHFLLQYLGPVGPWTHSWEAHSFWAPHWAPNCLLPGLVPGLGAPGPGLPGLGLPGPGLPGAGLPGPGLPGPGPGSPGGGLPGGQSGVPPPGLGAQPKGRR